MERKPDPTEGDRDLNFYPVDTSTAETLSVEQLRHFNEAGYISPIDVFHLGKTRFIVLILNEEWQKVAPASVGWDEKLLAAALSYAKQQDSSSVVILHGGKILAEGHWSVDGRRYGRLVAGVDAQGHVIKSCHPDFLM